MTSHSTLLYQQADTATMRALSGRICPQPTDTPAAESFGVCPSQHSAETLGCRSAGTRANQDAGFMAHQPSMQPTPMGFHVSQQSASQGRSERPGLLVSRMLALRLGITISGMYSFQHRVESATKHSLTSQVPLVWPRRSAELRELICALYSCSDRM